MRIRSSAWHYRVWAFFQDYRQPTNLCQYFWGIVGPSVLLTVIVGSVLSLLIYIAVWHTRDFLTGVAILVVIVGVFVGAYYADKWVKNRTPGAPREPGPFRAYLKARKERICPLITVEYDR